MRGGKCVASVRGREEPGKGNQAEAHGRFALPFVTR